MSINCEKEIIEHNKQLNQMKKIHEAQNINNQQKMDMYISENEKLTKENNNLIINNKDLTNKYETVVDAKDKECNERIETEKIKNEELKMKTQKLFGGFREFLNNFENKISGGIIGEIKKNLKTNYNNEINYLRTFNSNHLKGGANMKGGNPILFTIGAVIKIILMTLGTFIFDWWPIMMILSFYCVYVEYKMTLLTGQEIMGTPIIFLLGAYFCPCFWAIARLGVGWTTTKQTSPGLFNVLSKCTNDNITLNFDHYYGKPCKQTKCLWTTDECFNALFGKSDSGIMGNITGNITSSISDGINNISGNNKK